MKIKEGMGQSADAVLQQWKSCRLEPLQTLSLADFEKSYTQKMNKQVASLMKETTQLVSHADAVCKKLNISAADFTAGKLPEVKSFSHLGLLIFTMGTAQKLLASKCAAKPAPDTCAKA